MGRRLTYQYGCGSCHSIPGVPEANGMIGPPLSRFGQRSHIAGTLANTPENLFSWIMRPKDVDPETAMPDSGVTEEQARQIAAYLYTLE